MFSEKYYLKKLDEAIKYHGHLCSGQAIGVKMALYAIELLGLGEKQDYKNMKVYIESDRCIADSIMTTTGCKLGKRRVVFLDYGKTAATFVNMDTKQGYRIYRKRRLYPDDNQDIADFFAKLKNEEIFEYKKVYVDIKPEDMPGLPIGATVCDLCKEEVIDLKEIMKDGKTLCKNCANTSYYKVI